MKSLDLIHPVVQKFIWASQQSPQLRTTMIKPYFEFCTSLQFYVLLFCDIFSAVNFPSAHSVYDVFAPFFFCLVIQFDKWTQIVEVDRKMSDDIIKGGLISLGIFFVF
jgi:hypothetical protein